MLRADEEKEHFNPFSNPPQYQILKFNVKTLARLKFLEHKSFINLKLYFGIWKHKATTKL